MSQRCYNWQPGVAPTAINGADLDAASVANAALAGSITSDKLSKPYAQQYLVFQQAAPAAVTALAAIKLSQAGVVNYVGGVMGDAGTSGAQTIDVHIGGTYASHHTVFGTGAKVVMTPTDNQTFTAIPSGALGTVVAGDFLRVDVDSVLSGTKANLTVVVGIKTLLIA